MILLAILNIGYWIISTISNAVFPIIPEGLSSVLLYIIRMIQNGLDVLAAWFIDFSFVGPLCAWIIDVWLVLLAVDLLWKVIGYIKLSRKN